MKGGGGCLELLVLLALIDTLNCKEEHNLKKLSKKQGPWLGSALQAVAEGFARSAALEQMATMIEEMSEP